MPIAWGGVLLAAQLGSSAYAANKAEEEAQKNRDFQLYGSSSAYQRSVQDMRAAGLNPILAASRGGASTPSGAQASQFFSADAGVNTAMQARRQREEFAVMAAQRKNLEADALLKDRQEMLTRYQGQKVREETHLTQTERLIQEEMLKGARVEGQIDEGKVGEWSRILRRVIPGVNSAAGAVRSVR